MSKYKEQLGHRTPAELDEMYASVDIHGTGQVDFLTFAEMRVRKKNHTQMTVAVDTPGKKPKMTSVPSEQADGTPAQSKGWLATQISNMLGLCGCVSHH